MGSPVLIDVVPDNFPVVWVGETADADWDDCRGYPFPTLKAAKLFSSNTAKYDRLHCWVVDKDENIIHETHPAPRRVIRKKKP